MSAKKSAIAALAFASVIGIGGGFGTRLLAEGMSSVEPGSDVVRTQETHLRVVDVKGDAWLLSPHGDWRPAREGDSVVRPTALRVADGDGMLRLSGGGVVIDASHGAAVKISAVGNLRLYLDRGLVTVESSEETVEASLPGQDIEVAGRSFGIWTRRDRTVIAAIAREAVAKRSGAQERFPAGNEVVVGSGELVPVPMPPELRIEIDNAERRGDHWAVSGRTSKNAVLIHNGAGAKNDVEISADGKFTALLSASAPRPKELVAYDAAGREAQVNQPSPSLETVAAEARRAGTRRPSRENASTELSDRAPPPAARPETAPTRAEPDRPVAKAKVKEEPKPKVKEDPKAKAKEAAAKVAAAKAKAKKPDPRDGLIQTREVKPPDKEEKAAPQKDKEDDDELKLEWD